MQMEMIEDLLNAARMVLAENEDTMQVIIVQTSSGKKITQTVQNVMDESHLEEDKLLHLLSVNRDDPAEVIVCMWDNGQIDLPSCYFRNGVTKIAGDQSVQYVLENAEGIVIKLLSMVNKFVDRETV